MEDWLRDSIALESARRSKINYFTSIVGPFLDRLQERISKDIRAFTGVFEQEAISVHSGNRLEFHVSNVRAGNPIPSVTVSASPYQMCLYLEFAGVGPYSIKTPLRVENGEAQLASFESEDYAISATSRLILYPILFPSLPHDPAVYRVKQL